MTYVRLAMFAALVLACSPDDSDGRTTTGVTITGVSTATMTAATMSATMTATMTAATTTAATDDATSTPTSTPTTGGPGETSNATSELTTAEPEDTTGLIATSEEPPPSVDLPPPPPEGDYAAMVFPGDPTRISVRKADSDNDLCTTITFLSPGEGSPLEYDVQLPAMWFVQGAVIHEGAAGCLAFEGPAGEPVVAYSGNGTATWAGACPATVDIDVTLAFELEQPWVPVEVLLQDAAVPVGGC